MQAEMNIPSVLSMVFEFLKQQRLHVEVSKSPLSSDTGLMPLWEVDRQLS